MALINRVARLFKADMHAILDNIEEPDILLRQSIREMEECVNLDGRHLKNLALELQQIQEQLGEYQHSLQSLGEELQLCLKNDNDHLARTLIKRKLETEQLTKIMQHKIKRLNNEQQSAQQRLHENTTRLQSLKQKAELVSKQTRNSSDSFSPTLTSVHISDEDIEVALLREKQAMTEKPKRMPS